MAESLPIGLDNAETLPNLVPLDEHINTVENRQALQKEDQAIAEQQQENKQNEDKPCETHGQDMKELQGGNGDTHDTKEIEPASEDPHAPSLPQVPDYVAITRRGQFQCKKNIKTEKAKKKEDKEMNQGKGGGKTKGKGGKGKRQNGKGKGKGKSKQAAAQSAEAGKNCKLRNSKRRAAKKAKAKRAAAALKRRRLAEDSSSDTDAHKDTNNVADTEQSQQHDTKTTKASKARKGNSANTKTKSRKSKAASKSGKKPGTTRAGAKTAKKNPKRSAEALEDANAEHCPPVTTKGAAKTKARKAKGKAAETPAGATEHSDGQNPSLDPHANPQPPAQVPRPPQPGADPVVPPQVADDGESMVAEAGGLGLMDLVVETCRKKALDMYRTCYNHRQNCCLSDHTDFKFPKYEGVQFSVYWSRTSVGVKIDETLLREDLRKGRNKFQQIGYFSGGKCAHVNIMAADIWVGSSNPHHLWYI